MDDNYLDNVDIYEICDLLHKCYSAPYYCVMCGNDIVCSTGSDIIDADNVVVFLCQKYPEKSFHISSELISFE